MKAPTLLRYTCGHDSFSVDGCEYCAAADEVEALERAAGFAYFALGQEDAAYEDPIAHVSEGCDRLAPFFPSGVDHAGKHRKTAVAMTKTSHVSHEVFQASRKT